MSFIQPILTHWYLKNQRDLPWRHTKSAYHIWLSEIIMQQTQVIQGTKYYINFINTFITINDLANADEDLIFKMWQGLGYYNRARNLHYTAKVIRDEHNGKFPSDYNEILKLKGIGIYTAAAISTFAFNNPKPLVDGNVYRLYSRLFNISTPINSSKGQKEFIELAESLLNSISKENAIIYNQAIMEYGALVCKPKNPNCDTCQLKKHCLSNSKGLHLERPIKTKAKPKRNRYFSYYILSHLNKIWIEKRGINDIWSGLHQPLLIEHTNLDNEWNQDFPTALQNRIIHESSVIKHVLSHQNINTKFHIVELKSKSEIDLNAKGFWIEKKTWKDYGFPQLIVNFLKTQF